MLWLVIRRERCRSRTHAVATQSSTSFPRPTFRPNCGPTPDNFVRQQRTHGSSGMRRIKELQMTKRPSRIFFLAALSPRPSAAKKNESGARDSRTRTEASCQEHGGPSRSDLDTEAGGSSVDRWQPTWPARDPGQQGPGDTVVAESVAVAVAFESMDLIFG